MAALLVAAFLGVSAEQLAEISSLQDKYRMGESLVLIDAALKVEPGDRDLHVSRAVALLTLNRLVELEDELERQIQLFDDARTHALLGRTRLQLGDDAGARAPLERALALDPSLASARESLDDLARYERLRRGGEEPDTPAARAVLATIHELRLGNVTQVLDLRISPALLRNAEGALANAPPEERRARARDGLRILGRLLLEQHGEILGIAVDETETTATGRRVHVQVLGYLTTSGAEATRLRNQWRTGGRTETSREDREMLALLGPEDQDRYFAEMPRRRPFAIRDLRIDVAEEDGVWRVREITIHGETALSIEQELVRWATAANARLEDRAAGGRSWGEMAAATVMFFSLAGLVLLIRRRGRAAQTA